MPLLDLAEQRQIAAVLSAVQRAVERQERLIALTAELKKALMHRLFTEGTRGEPLKQTEIGPVPESWEVVPLGSLAKIGNGSTPKRDNLTYWAKRHHSVAYQWENSRGPHQEARPVRDRLGEGGMSFACGPRWQCACGHNRRR